MIRNSTRFHCNKYFAKNSSNVKKFRTGINKSCNKSNSKNKYPVCIVIDNDGNVNTITDPKDIADEFNLHYTAVAKKILKERENGGNKSYKPYLKNHNPFSSMVKPTLRQYFKF